MATFASPRLQISEVDMSEFLSNLPTSIGLLVVDGVRGPIQPRFISSVGDFKRLYCRTRMTVDKGKVSLLSGVKFLENGYSGLWVCRALNSGTKGACIVVNTSDSTSATTTIADGLSLNSDKTDYVYPDWSTLASQDITPLLLFYVKSPGALGNNFALKIEQVNAIGKTFKLTIKETLPDGSVEIRYEGVVSLVPDAKDGYGRSIYILDVFANHDDIGVKLNTDVTGVPKEVVNFVSFAGGVDVDITLGDIGDPIQQFANTEQYDVDLLIQGGIGGDAYRVALVNLAEGRADCMALVDIDYGKEKVEDLKAWRQNNFMISSSYGAVFAPWIKVYDYDNDSQIELPPSGLIAGMMARMDYEYDPWWVPAGLKRGVIKALGLTKYYSLAERDELDKIQINMIARRPGALALWNNRTLQTFESAFSFIETRRLLNYVKRNVKRTLEGFLFEPLVEETRKRVVRVLDGFFRVIKQRLGVYDYKVVSDPIGTGNNPAQNIDQGLLTVDVYLKPVRAIRYIWLRLKVTSTGASFEERTV